YTNPAPNQNAPVYDINCKPNYLSSMNYLFQVRGFPGADQNTIVSASEPNPIDYSGQTLELLLELQLNEPKGIGTNTDPGAGFGGNAAHLTRWYAPLNELDKFLGTRSAPRHCDGSPKAANESAVRVDGGVTPIPYVPPYVDWNNNHNIEPP